MKLRPFLILLLFVLSAVILVWIYYAATHAPRKPRAVQWAEVISDLDACGRRKHLKSTQYAHFAEIAKTERHPDAARLFRAMALSERLQERNCVTAIVRLGGSYIPPAKVTLFQGTTDSNLAQSITYERKALATTYGEQIDRAFARSNRYAARVLIWASTGDLHHIVLMEHCRYRQAHQPRESTTYVVCPICGNIYDTEYCTPYCPLCLTEGRTFIHFN